MVLCVRSSTTAGGDTLIVYTTRLYTRGGGRGGGGGGGTRKSPLYLLYLFILFYLSIFIHHTTIKNNISNAIIVYNVAYNFVLSNVFLRLDLITGVVSIKRNSDDLVSSPL